MRGRVLEQLALVAAARRSPRRRAHDGADRDVAVRRRRPGLVDRRPMKSSSAAGVRRHRADPERAEPRRAPLPQLLSRARRTPPPHRVRRSTMQRYLRHSTVAAVLALAAWSPVAKATVARAGTPATLGAQRRARAVTALRQEGAIGPGIPRLLRPHRRPRSPTIAGRGSRRVGEAALRRPSGTSPLRTGSTPLRPGRWPAAPGGRGRGYRRSDRHRRRLLRPRPVPPLAGSRRRASSPPTTLSTTTARQRPQRSRHARCVDDRRADQQRHRVTGIAYGATLMPLRASTAPASATRPRSPARSVTPPITTPTHSTFQSRFDVRLGAPCCRRSFRRCVATPQGTPRRGRGGNQAARNVSYPARSNYALAVGATTDPRLHRRLFGRRTGLDIVAPGGGADSGVIDVRKGSTDRVNCSSAASRLRSSR